MKKIISELIHSQCQLHHSQISFHYSFFRLYTSTSLAPGHQLASNTSTLPSTHIFTYSRSVIHHFISLLCPTWSLHTYGLESRTNNIELVPLVHLQTPSFCSRSCHGHHQLFTQIYTPDITHFYRSKGHQISVLDLLSFSHRLVNSLLLSLFVFIF